MLRRALGAAGGLAARGVFQQAPAASHGAHVLAEALGPRRLGSTACSGSCAGCARCSPNRGACRTPRLASPSVATLRSGFYAGPCARARRARCSRPSARAKRLLFFFSGGQAAPCAGFASSAVALPIPTSISAAVKNPSAEI